MTQGVVKCILLGPTGVGKTSMLHRYISGTFDNNFVSTIGVEFGAKNLTIDNKEYKLQIWDTAGQERFRSLIRSYYRGVHVALFCFSLINDTSLTDLEEFIQEFKAYEEPNVVKILVGTFKDKYKGSPLTQANIEDLMTKYEIASYYEISSKNNMNINELFSYAITKVKQLEDADKLSLKKTEQFEKVEVTISPNRCC